MPSSRSSTRAAALQLVAFFVVGMRLATLAQMAPSFVPALSAGEHRALTAASWAIALVALLTIAAIALVRRRPTGTAWAVADVAIAVVLVVLATGTVPLDLRLGTWIGFQPGYNLCIALSMPGVRRLRHWLPLLLVLVAAEAAYLAPTVQGWSDLPRLLGSILTILVIGPLVWACTRVLLQIGGEADEARELAAASAREAEERRARTAIHNGTALMRVLVDSGVDGARLPGLRRQAEIELARMRAYLTGAPVLDTAEPTTLAAIVTAAGAEFDDLPVTIVADLAEQVEIDRALADDLAAALRSLLLNVRQHAGAERVVLHAEELEDGDGWELTVHDDGVGFEADAASYGVGIRDVVVHQLAQRGVDTGVTSVPGIGTTVTLTGRGRR